MLVKGLTIYAENHIIENGCLLTDGPKIKMIGNGDHPELKTHENVFTFSSNYKLIPGMIDIHIHGAGGADTMDATPEALKTIASVLPKEGTTSYLATTITQEPLLIENALKNAAKYIKNQSSGGMAEVLGVHLEGPFINKERAGAQPKQYIIGGDIDLFDKWQTLTDGYIKLVTLAPEVGNNMELVRHLSEHGVVASIGHSDATFDEVHVAVEAGARHVTHLYNGMNSFHHRKPGIIGGAFLHNELFVEMIVDGIHICPESVDIAYRMKGKNHIILVTDAMRAKCLRNGMYELGGQPITVLNGKATLENGTLAGSVLKMDAALRHMMRFTKANLKDVIQMGAVNPAKQMDVFDRKGSIKEGKDADFVILDEQDEVVMTICRGNIAYERDN